jgi:23S rRNA pseudouridine2605 synthase
MKLLYIHHMTDASGLRLQKYIASRTELSRRGAEAAIAGGRVELNGNVMVEPGVRVTENDEVKLDGKILGDSHVPHYFKLHKPAGVMTTMSDPQNRPTIKEYFPKHADGLFPVGRLDFETTGLLLLTNDGQWANQLLHPKFKCQKVYEIEVEGVAAPTALQKLLDGVELSDGDAKADAVSVLGETEKLSHYTMTLHQGRNRIVRRMWQAIGYPVVKLKRQSMGPIQLMNLELGQSLALTQNELRSIELLHSINQSIND